MAALIHRVARRWCSSSRCLGARIIRETHNRSPGRFLPGAAGLLSSVGRPLTPYGRAQHTEAAGPVEVDLKRLEGEDDGRKNGQNSGTSSLNMQTKRAVTGGQPVKDHTVTRK